MRGVRRTLPYTSSYFDVLLTKGACSLLTAVELVVVRRSFLVADCLCDTRFMSPGNSAVCRAASNIEYFWCIPKNEMLLGIALH
jgi:hypothetical protein